MPPVFAFLSRPARTLLGFAAVAAAFSLLTACEPTLDAAPKASAGSADFGRYIAVGNSLTAGFADNGLYREGQLNSYPLMLAEQFKLAGGGEFVQPLFAPDQSNGTGYLRLSGFDAAGAPVLGSVTEGLAVRDTVPATVYTKYLDPINNLGVPGLRMADIKRRDVARPGAERFNALYERLVPTGSTQTYLQRVTASAPTFFTCWLGNNDVLGYATSGGALSILQNANYGLTPDSVFTNRTNALVDVLTATGAKGVVGLIPDVRAIPFFNTVGPRVKARLLSQNITQLVAVTGGVTFSAPLPDSIRPIQVSDIKDATGGRQLFTLTASPYADLIGTPSGQYWRDFKDQSGLELVSLWGLDTTQAFGLSPKNPWPSVLLLDELEQARVQAATNAFNNTLRAKAEAKGLAVLDAYTFFNGIAAQGLATSGVSNTTSYISGHLFSLDGVHPSPRGYAVVANELVRIINEKYGATLPPVDPGQYRGVKLP